MGAGGENRGASMTVAVTLALMLGVTIGYFFLDRGQPAAIPTARPVAASSDSADWESSRRLIDRLAGTSRLSPAAVQARCEAVHATLSGRGLLWSAENVVGIASMVSDCWGGLNPGTPFPLDKLCRYMTENIRAGTDRGDLVAGACRDLEP